MSVTDIYSHGGADKNSHADTSARLLLPTGPMYSSAMPTYTRLSIADTDTYSYADQFNI